MAKILQPEKLQGKYVNLREVTVDDAEFILKLRCSNKAKLLHKTENNLQKQIDYIKKYLSSNNEWYFIIEDKNHIQIGTHRIVNIDNFNFSTESWIMSDDAKPNETIESFILIVIYAFNVLNLKCQHFYTNKDNKKMILFAKFIGAREVGFDGIEYSYEATRDDYRFFRGEKC